MANVKVYNHMFELLHELEIEPGVSDHTQKYGMFSSDFRDADASWLGYSPVGDSDIEYVMGKIIKFRHRFFSWFITCGPSWLDSPDREVHFHRPTINSFMDTALRKFSPKYYNRFHSRLLGYFWDKVCKEYREDKRLYGDERGLWAMRREQYRANLSKM